MSTVLLSAWLLAASLQDRVPIPDAAARAEALKLIRDIFKDDFAKGAPADRQKLALKLLQQGIDSKDDPVSRFVLLQEARGLASEIGDAPTALRAIEELASQFEVNRLALKHTALSTASLNARDPAQMSDAAEPLLTLADEAMAALELETAEKSIAAALNLAKGAKNVPLTGRANAKAKEVADLKPKFAAAQKARETLKTASEDPAANLALGRFTCIVLGNWEAGLPFLAKGSDAALKALATKEQTVPAEPADQAALGDAWWEYAEKEAGKAKENTRARAFHWYQTSQPRLTGLARARVEKRLVEFPLPGRPSIDLMRLVDPKKDPLGGPWELAGNALITTADQGILELRYAVPAEYDLVIKIERKSENRINALFLDLPSVECKAGLAIDQEETGDISGMGLIDGKRIAENGTMYKGRLLKKDIPSTIVCAMRRTGVAMYVDGKRIFDWKGDLRRLSNNHVENTIPKAIRLCNQARFRITAIQLIPLGDPGKPMR